MQDVLPGPSLSIILPILRSFPRLPPYEELKMSPISGFEPRLLGFLCHWCAYAGADGAGVSRLQYPSNLRSIRIMCSGRVDAAFLLDAFLHGYDGIWVGG